MVKGPLFWVNGLIFRVKSLNFTVKGLSIFRINDLILKVKHFLPTYLEVSLGNT